MVYPDGTTEFSLVIGKSRIAPLRTVSIPRLELQAAVLAVRMDSTVRNELEDSVQTR